MPHGGSINPAVGRLWGPARPLRLVSVRGMVSGLGRTGSMGTSKSGHMNLGAGADCPIRTFDRGVTKAIVDGDFSLTPNILPRRSTRPLRAGPRVHVMGHAISLGGSTRHGRTLVGHGLICGARAGRRVAGSMPFLRRAAHATKSAQAFIAKLLKIAYQRSWAGHARRA